MSDETKTLWVYSTDLPAASRVSRRGCRRPRRTRSAGGIDRVEDAQRDTGVSIGGEPPLTVRTQVASTIALGVFRSSCPAATCTIRG